MSINVESLNQVFGTQSFKMEKAEVNSSALISHNEIVLPDEKEEQVKLENKRYVKGELENLLASCSTVIQQTITNMEEDSRPSAIMAFADLIRTTNNLLHELNEMDRIENDLNIKKANSKNLKQIANNSSGPSTVNNTIVLTGKDMVDKILEFKKNSEMNAIDTTFVEEDPITDV